MFKSRVASRAAYSVRFPRLVVRVVLLQTGCTLAVASVFLVLKGSLAGLAALAGGLIVALGSLLLGWRMFKPGVAGAATLSTAMYVGVAMKWLWFMLALYVVLAQWKLPAGPLLIGLLAAQVSHWAALIRAK